MASGRYTQEQLRNARILAGASRRPIIRKAIVEAGLVESGLRNLQTPVDHDSVGVLQQRPSQGWGPAGEPVSTDAAQFVRAAQKVLSGGFRGSAGQLAQAVQRSAFPGRYAQRSGEAEALLGSSRGGGGGGSSSPAASLPEDGGGSTDVPQGADVSGAVAALLSQAQARSRPVSAPAAPAHSAQAALPQGFAAPSSGGPPAAPGFDVSALLDAVRTQGGDIPSAGGPDAPQPRIQAPGGTSAGGSSHGIPTGVAGKVIGTPNTGTHTLGNWQSDNAVDIAVPKGTPMVSLQDGVVVKVRHHPQDGGRFAGDQITIRGANGNEYFYAHGVADVKAGQRVRKGQSLGVTGSANGVEHLHFGQMRGDPRAHTRRR